MIRLLFNLAPNPMKIALHGSRSLASVRGDPRSTQQGRAARGRPSAPSIRTGRCRRSSPPRAGRPRGAGVRFRAPSCLTSAGKDRALHWRSRRSARTVVVAVLHRHRSWGSFPVGGAFQHGAEKMPYASIDTDARSSDIIGSGQASGRPETSSSAANYSIADMSVWGWLTRPRACCPARMTRLRVPESQRPDETVARVRCGAARAIRVKTPFKTGVDEETKARCFRQITQRLRCDSKAERSDKLRRRTDR